MREEFIIREELTPALKSSHYAGFSNSIDAILELTDNAIGNRLPNRSLKVEILLSPKSITIIDRGSRGMSLEDLDFFAKWGKPKERSFYDIGVFAQGGKAAMGYLGGSMTIISSPDGQKEQYRIEDYDLHDLSKLKEYVGRIIPGNNLEGCTQVEVGKLKRKIDKDKLKEKLADTYRPLIIDRVVDIYLNGEKIKTKPFPLDANYQIKNFKFMVNNQKVRGWKGRLAPRSNFKGGIRCYSKGRLICDKEFFNHPDPSKKGTLNFLFGEVHLDQIPVVPNKTDFDRDSTEWIETQQWMFKILKPDVDELYGREIEEPTEEEIKRVNIAREIVADLMRMKQREEIGTSLENKEDYGQKPREPRKETKDYSISDTTRGRYKPATPPPPNAIGKRKRTRQFMDWELRPMGESIRSKIEKHKAGDNSSNRLIINNIFSGYKANRGNILYLIETAALQMAKSEDEEKIKPDEFIAQFDELFSFFCNNLEKAKENLKKKEKEIL